MFVVDIPAQRVVLDAPDKVSAAYMAMNKLFGICTTLAIVSEVENEGSGIRESRLHEQEVPVPGA